MRRSFFFVILLSANLAHLACGQGLAHRDIGKIDDKDLDELSGCAVSKQNSGVLWVHNDGETDSIYAIRTSGQVVARVQLPVKVEDLEDIALGLGPDRKTECLYVGDIGDNDRKRDSIRILCFPEPLVTPKGTDIRVPYLEVFSLFYPDRKHDAEALLVDPINGMILIVTKDKSEAQIFAVETNSPRRASNFNLRPIGQLAVQNISGGDISRDGSRVILRREDRGWLWTRRPCQSLAATILGRPREVPVRGSSQGANGESVGFAPNGDAYVTISEGKMETICVFQLN